jgi:hypothetical protein
MQKNRESSKAYARRNPEKVKARSEAWRTDPETRPIYLYSVTKQNCKKNGRELALTFDDFKSLCQQPCHYCDGSGVGVDRVDSSKGYTKDNVVPCCTFCNQMKSDKLVGDFLAKVRAIYLHSLVEDALQQILDTLPDSRV